MATLKNQNNIKHFVEGLKQLPTLAPVAARLLELVEDKSCSINDVSKIIEVDQSLSSKVLYLANLPSINSGHKKKVSTVEQAISVLGLDMVRNVTNTVTVQELPKPDCKSTFNLIGFWRHNISTAIASKIFAEQFGYPNPDEAFFAGLLHDIGKFVFFHWNSEQYNKVMTKAKTTRTMFLEIEEAHFGIGHTRIAKMLMEHWSFPDILISAAWLHHQPMMDGVSGFDQVMPLIVKCADSLCHLYHLGDNGHTSNNMDFEELKKVAGLSNEEVDQLSVEVLNRFEEVYRFFDWEDNNTEPNLSTVSRLSNSLTDLQVELISTNRRHKMAQRLNESFKELQKVLQLPISIGKVVENIIGIVGQGISCSQIMVFLFFEQEKVIKGWVKIGYEGITERLSLPVNEDKINNQNIRRMVNFSEESLIELCSEKLITDEIKIALHNTALIILPLKHCDNFLGNIMVVLNNNKDWTREEETEFLNQFAAITSTILGQVLFVEELDQQAEDMARIARKDGSAKKQVCNGDRLTLTKRLSSNKTPILKKVKAKTSGNKKVKKDKAYRNTLPISMLVINDDEILRSILKESFTSKGFKVDVASDGTEGILKITDQVYDVVILDLGMPRKKGIEVLETIKKNSPQLPVIIISGVAHDNEFDSAKKAGATACLQKPFDINELLNVVNNVTKTHS